MLTTFSTLNPPVVRYVGDAETGIVHRIGSSCGVSTNEVFLDVRTAIIRGYQLCRCCHPME